jgi:hypothetical protein
LACYLQDDTDYRQNPTDDHNDYRVRFGLLVLGRENAYQGKYECDQTATTREYYENHDVGVAVHFIQRPEFARTRIVIIVIVVAPTPSPARTIIRVIVTFSITGTIIRFFVVIFIAGSSHGGPFFGVTLL